MLLAAGLVTIDKDLVDSPQSFGCLGVPLSRCQSVVPPGLVVVLGDAFTLLVTFLRRAGVNAMHVRLWDWETSCDVKWFD